MVKSKITGKTYQDTECVYYKNAKQSAWMLKNQDVELMDLIPTKDNYLIFVFKKSDHKKYIAAWNATAPNTK